MIKKHFYDAAIVGAGPNGLAAAITLAQAGRSVIVFEAQETIGGGMRTRELTLPGFSHDVCSTIHPLGLASPFFRTLPLASYGLEWIHPTTLLAHPLDDGTAMLLERSVAATAATLGLDAQAYEKLVEPLIEHWDVIMRAFVGPLNLQLLQHPFALAPFGLSALYSARDLVKMRFKGERARAMLAGLCAHSMLPLERLTSSAAGLLLGTAGHVSGWPLARGGSQQIANALAAYLCALGGEIVTGVEVKSLDDLPPSRAILCDVTPRQLVRLANRHLPKQYKRSLQHYRYGPGVFKMDFALDGPIPWRAEGCAQAGTVHLGGTFSEIAASERQAWRGRPPEKPYVLLAQPGLFDATRAPVGKQVAWAYCHVPSGSTFDMAERIEAQIERFAPGFRERILARHSMTPADLERYNANYIGGDINGGVQDLWQLFTRPVARLDPYTTPLKHLFICSSSTPPGGGVHGLCGYFAAQSALRRCL